MRIIDLETWPRRSHYLFFRRYAKPQFALTAEIDVTYLMTDLKPAGISPFNAALFALTRAANRIPELRTRFRGDQVIEHEVINPSVTVPIDEERFAFCNIEYCADWPEFDRRCREAVQRAASQTELTDTTGDQWLYLSCLPWTRLTAITNATNGPDDCMPRVVWGRIFESGTGWHMAVGLEAHHALVDGIHVGRFFAAVEDEVRAIPIPV